MHLLLAIVAQDGNEITKPTEDNELKVGPPETPKYRRAERVGELLFIVGHVPHDSENVFVAAAKHTSNMKRSDTS